MMKICVVCVFITLSVLAPRVLGGEHSLFYTYTALSKPPTHHGISEFTALGMLDDRELDYYSSDHQTKVPKQDWMREKMPADYWEKGTQSRKSKEQWFKVNVDILIDRMRHNKTDLHVLQWRHGCVVNERSDGNMTFLRGVDEYSYDGSEFLSFDEVNSRWIAPMPAAEPTKRKWDDVQILNQYTKGYLEKECVDWLQRFMDYGKETLKNSWSSPPELHILVKKSLINPDKRTLTCLATGFYPPDIVLQVRKCRTTLPEHLVTSSGVRPNGDGTYQLRKSVEILEEDKLQYDCYVSHSTLEKPIYGPRDPDCTGSSILGGAIGGVVGVILILAVVGVVIFLKKRKGSQKRVIQRTAPEGENEVNVLMPTVQKEDDRQSDSGRGSGASSNSSREKISENEVNVPMLPGNVSDASHSSLQEI